MSDFKGAALIIDAFPKTKTLLGDKGYDADWFRDALADRKITACIPSKANRKVQIPHDTALYRQRHKIENMFGRLKAVRVQMIREIIEHEPAASTPATTAAPTPSCLPPQSPQPSSFAPINEP